MARYKTLKNPVSMLVYVETEDKIFLKSKGISNSLFVRQAINALKNKQWEYNHLEQ